MSRGIDILITTPKKEMANSAAEAEQIKAAGHGNYFRTFTGNTPKGIKVGSRVFYTEDGYIRGYCRVSEIVVGDSLTCDTTGRKWGPGTHLIMNARTWTWIRPVPYKGFQGWRYLPLAEIDICEVGGWLHPKPATPKS